MNFVDLVFSRLTKAVHSRDGTITSDSIETFSTFSEFLKIVRQIQFPVLADRVYRRLHTAAAADANIVLRPCFQPLFLH